MGPSDRTEVINDLTSVTGIGPVFAEKLDGLGINKLEELASAEADTLAAALDISVTRVEGWQAQAREPRA